MAESTTYTQADFEPIEIEQAKQTLSRPSLSYWEDAWIRLKANRRALISLYIVLGLLVFTIFGPFVWTVDPASQDLDQVSQPPWADRSATLVAPYVPWSGETLNPDGPGLRTAETPNTQAVRLIWNAMPTAVGGYRVYRNVFPIGPERAFGLPLGEHFDQQITHFEDRLDLKSAAYYYSVVPLDEFGNELGGEITELIEVKNAITISGAVKRVLLPPDNNARVGDSITLAAHPLGTDYLGRDILSRLMYGARVSLFIGIVAPFLYVLLGVVWGATAGFLGGRMDGLMMRFADFVVALPFLLFMILFKIMFGIGPGESGIMPMLIAMVILSWPATSRLVRGQILQIREEGYIGASRLLGAKTNYLVLRHMIPNTMGVILVTLTFAVPSAIFTEAFLSFIGMGVAPPTPSWGSMCNEGIKTMLTTPHELIFPALFISVTVLAFNLLGDGLRDALDARMRSRE